MMKADLPVFGTALSKGGVSLVTPKAIDYEARPEFLSVEDAYGLIVSGDAMDPECKNGSTVLVNPHLPPKNGDTCVFRSAKDNGEIFATVGQLVRRTDRAWIVHQHNARKDFELKRSEWQTCHTIVGNYSRH